MLYFLAMTENNVMKSEVKRYASDYHNVIHNSNNYEILSPVADR